MKKQLIHNKERLEKRDSLKINILPEKGAPDLKSDSQTADNNYSWFRCWRCGLYQGDSELCECCNNRPPEDGNN
jgi:hypothetical protein